jgi:hypothetical protein
MVAPAKERKKKREKKKIKNKKTERGFIREIEIRST